MPLKLDEVFIMIMKYLSVVLLLLLYHGLQVVAGVLAGNRSPHYLIEVRSVLVTLLMIAQKQFIIKIDQNSIFLDLQLDEPTSVVKLKKARKQ